MGKASVPETEPMPNFFGVDFGSYVSKPKEGKENVKPIPEQGPNRTCWLRFYRTPSKSTDSFARQLTGRQAQRFVTAHAAVSNLFNLGRHLVRAQPYRDLRMSALAEWSRVVA